MWRRKCKKTSFWLRFVCAAHDAFEIHTCERHALESKLLLFSKGKLASDGFKVNKSWTLKSRTSEENAAMPNLTLESFFYRKKWHFTSRVSAQDAFTFVLLFSSKRPACSPIFLWQVVVNFLALTEIGNYFRNRRSFRKQKTPL